MSPAVIPRPLSSSTSNLNCGLIHPRAGNITSSLCSRILWHTYPVRAGVFQAPPHPGEKEDSAVKMYSILCRAGRPDPPHTYTHIETYCLSTSYTSWVLQAMCCMLHPSSSWCLCVLTRCMHDDVSPGHIIIQWKARPSVRRWWSQWGNAMGATPMLVSSPPINPLATPAVHAYTRKRTGQQIHGLRPRPPEGVGWGQPAQGHAQSAL